MKYKTKRLYDFMGNIKGHEYRGYKIIIYVDVWNYKEYGIRELNIYADTLKEVKKKLDEYLEGSEE